MKRRPSCCWILLLLAVALLACNPSPPPPVDPVEPPPTPPPPPAETVTPGEGASQEELENIPAPPPVRPEAEGWADTAPPPVPEPGARTTFGYRVQVYASATREGAERAAASARAALQEAVTVEYEAPFYKVRVGNCVTRHEAERLKERAVQEGYEGPFITETRVEVQ